MLPSGIFDHEFAQRVRAEFEGFMGAGMSAYAAAEAVLVRHASRQHDFDDEPALFFALAELQLERGALSPRVRKRALTLINSGDSLARWEHFGAEVLAARNRVEQDLRRRLAEGV